MIVSIIAALLAGACFAMAGLLQQRVASTRPEGESLSPKLMGQLVRQKLWVAGISLALLSYVFQSVALAFGPLSLVQPLIVTELIFALPVSARLHGLRLKAREWGGVAAVSAGLAVAIVAAHPREGNPLPPIRSWVWLVGVVVVIAVAAVLLGKRIEGAPRASTFAFAGAVVMASQSALLAATIAHFRTVGIGATFLHWQTYLLVVASIAGLLLIQSAYQAGPLASSMPVIDGVEPVGAIIIGVGIFGEHIAAGLGRHALAVVGLLCVLGGIVLLDTSPVIKRLHRDEQHEAEERSASGDDSQVGLSST